MQLVMRLSKMVHTDIKLDLDKDWKKLKQVIEEIRGDGFLEEADTQSKEPFISSPEAGSFSKSEFFNFLQNYNAGGKQGAHDHSDENYEIWTQ